MKYILGRGRKRVGVGVAKILLYCSWRASRQGRRYMYWYECFLQRGI